MLATLMPGEENAEAIIGRVHALGALGFTHVIFNMPHAYTLTPLRMIGMDVIPAVT